MGFEIALTKDAERDLEDIIVYIATHDSKQNAEHVLSRILERVDSLANASAKGSPVKELLSLGEQEYRQIFFNPNRLIYRTVGEQVIIYLISDGRRDMQSLLARRLLGG